MKKFFKFFIYYIIFLLTLIIEYINKSLGNIVLARGKTIKEFKVENLNQPVQFLRITI